MSDGAGHQAGGPVPALLIVNPAGTRVRAGRTEEVAERLADRLDLRIVETTGRGHATELAAGAPEAGVELVIVMGGDGTVNEVINGLPASMPLGLVGGGKTNVFARALGLPGEPMAAAARLLALIAGGTRRTISLGEASGRRFAFGAGLGLDGAIVREVERWRLTHRLHDDSMYLMAGLRTIATWDRSKPRLAVHLEDGRAPLRGFFAAAANGDPYTYLGGRPMRLTPEARFEGALEILVGQTMSPRLITRALAGMLSSNPLLGYPGLPILHDQRTCRLEADVPLPFQVDGEYLGDRASVELRSLPGALTVIAPASSAVPGDDDLAADGAEAAPAERSQVGGTDS